MFKNEWWNKPMTRKNWAVLYLIIVGTYIIGFASCLSVGVYWPSIKNWFGKKKKQATDPDELL